jgi:hypothetical protein
MLRVTLDTCKIYHHLQVTGVQDLHYVPYEYNILTWLKISGQSL